MLTSFHVVMAGRNCTDRLPVSIGSVLSQESPVPVDVSVIDDGSPQSTGYSTKAANLLLDEPTPNGHRLLSHRERLGAPYRIHETIRSHERRDEHGCVVVLVDADDELLPGALGRLADAYADPDVWMTWGSYEADPPDPDAPQALPYPEDVVAAGSYRSDIMRLNHPLTFRSDLFCQIHHADLLVDGAYPLAAYDQVLALPLVEMAREHARWLPDTLYRYWTANPEAVHRTQQDEGRKVGAWVRSSPRWPRLGYIDGDYVVSDGADRAAIVADYLRSYGIDRVIETGTGAGDLAAGLAALPTRPDVTTVDIVAETTDRANERLAPWPHARAVTSDSVQFIDEWTRGRDPYPTLPILWWLDAHIDNWADADPADTTPILAELGLILGRRAADVILIDDARLFGLAPGYPTIAELSDYVRERAARPVLIEVHRDIIRIAPRS